MHIVGDNGREESRDTRLDGEASEPRSQGAKLRVLLAEDNQAFADSVRDLLSGHVEVVGLARDGAEFVSLASTMAHDVIVADISMPEMSGIEALERLRADGCRSAVIFLTVHAVPALVRAAKKAGALGYVIKSTASEELLAAIRAVARGETFFSPALGAWRR